MISFRFIFIISFLFLLAIQKINPSSEDKGLESGFSPVAVSSGAGHKRPRQEDGKIIILSPKPIKMPVTQIHAHFVPEILRPAEPLPKGLEVYGEGIKIFKYIGIYQRRNHGKILSLILARCELGAYGELLPDVLGGLGLLRLDLEKSYDHTISAPFRLEISSRIMRELLDISFMLGIGDLPAYDRDSYISVKGILFNLREDNRHIEEIQRVVEHCPLLDPFLRILEEHRKISRALKRLLAHNIPPIQDYRSLIE